MISANIYKLVEYGLEKGLIQPSDLKYTVNLYLDIFGLGVPEPPETFCLVRETETLADILSPLLDYACAHGICANTPSERDRFDTKLMGVLVPCPSDIISTFTRDYKISPQLATDNFYNLCLDSDYIRRYRIEKDIKWKTQTEYGGLDLTINLAKPEKDPLDIAMAKNIKATGYPKCLLCAENEGYSGRLDHPARHNLRIIPLDICGEAWGFQYSPYVYYNEHCIVLNQKHVPMVIDDAIFGKLFAFVRIFPHYFVGSNADLPIVGGSILSHEHFQGGNYEFAMAKAPLDRSFSIPGFEEVSAGIVRWPLSVIRLSHEDDALICAAADHILKKWRGYTDADAFVFSQTGGTPHNSITPIARKRGEQYELDIVLRNNITTPEHPMGVFHPHAELHHIKKENIGLIEVMGLAVLPARLKSEIEELKSAIVNGRDYHSTPELSKHSAWVDSWRFRCENLPESEVDDIIREEIGKVFAKVLEHAGVFKRDEAGMLAFGRFLSTL